MSLVSITGSSIWPCGEAIRTMSPSTMLAAGFGFGVPASPLSESALFSVGFADSDEVVPLVSEAGGLSALALQQLAYVSGIIGTPPQAVDDEVQHRVRAFIGLVVIEARQEADEQDDVAGVDVGPEGAIRLPGVEQHRDRVADRPEAVT